MNFYILINLNLHFYYINLKNAHKILGEIMDISVKEMDSEVQIKILGSVKQSNVEILRETFDDVLTTTKKNVSIDLGFVSAMSSLGIGKLIYFHNELKIQNRKLTIVDINKSLNSLFNSMSLNQIFNFTG